MCVIYFLSAQKKTHMFFNIFVCVMTIGEIFSSLYGIGFIKKGFGLYGDFSCESKYIVKYFKIHKFVYICICMTTKKNAGNLYQFLFEIEKKNLY